MSGDPRLARYFQWGGELRPWPGELEYLEALAENDKNVTRVTESPLTRVSTAAQHRASIHHEEPRR